MKKLFSILVAGILVAASFMTSNAQSVTNNFEDGNYLYYYNLCWGIGPNSTYYGTKVTGNGFNSTDVCETDNLGQTATCILTSPWISMNGNDQISFTHAIRSFNGTRSLKVYLVQYPDETETLLWTYNYTNGNAQNALINHSAEGTYKVKWVWNGSNGNSRGQLDNIVIGGVYNSDPGNGCNPLPAPVVDTDTDGVPDAQDEFPEDQYRAYQNFYPAADTGTVVFEDLWPDYGDYDLNDMVVGYRYKVITDANQNVVELFVTFVLRAAGASYANGFGFNLPNVNPTSVISATGYNVQSSTFSIGANGTENGQSAATFIIFDRARKFLPNGNTVPGNPFNPYKRFNMYIKFMENGVPGAGGAVSFSTLNIQGFNPFLVSDDDRGKEVHLPGYPPTSLANVSYFGTGDDDTNLATGKYYQSKTNLPWGVHIAGEFDYPIEKVPVTEAYTKFTNWIQSSGSQYPDWFMDKPGYRVSGKIY